MTLPDAHLNFVFISVTNLSFVCIKHCFLSKIFISKLQFEGQRCRILSCVTTTFSFHFLDAFEKKRGEKVSADEGCVRIVGVVYGEERRCFRDLQVWRHFTGKKKKKNGVHINEEVLFHCIALSLVLFRRMARFFSGLVSSLWAMCHQRLIWTKWLCRNYLAIRHE